MTKQELIKKYNELVDEWNALIEIANDYLECIGEETKEEKERIE